MAIDSYKLLSLNKIFEYELKKYGMKSKDHWYCIILGFKCKNCRFEKLIHNCNQRFNDELFDNIHKRII